MAPSPEFLLLAATLLDSLPPSLPISDTLLLQLHAVFGPMLMSALQLVDKREVVRVTLPSERHVYQVASSTGKNYTIHLDPPSPTVLPLTALPDIPNYSSEKALPPAFKSDINDIQSPFISHPSIDAHNNDNEDNHKNGGDHEVRTPSPSSLSDEDNCRDAAARTARTAGTSSIPRKRRKAPTEEDYARRTRVEELARELERMYCPCAGWAYGSLAGEKTVLCKHLLAIVIAHKTNRDVKAEVGLSGVVALLGIGG